MAEPKEFLAVTGENEEEQKGPPPVGFFQLFRYSDGIDMVYMLVGTLSAMAHGCGLPAFSVVFGEIIDSMADLDTNPDTTDTVEDLQGIALIFLYIGLATFFCAALQTACWMVVAERLTNRMRRLYLESILFQDIEWFDTNDPGTLPTRVAEDTIKYQEGVGEKVAHYIQHMSMAVVGFIIAFIKGWKLTLVLLAAMPLMVISGYFIGKAMTQMATSGQEKYAKAGGVADEAISSLRTVHSFNGAWREIDRYTEQLRGALQIGKKKGLIGGLGIGMTMMVLFGCYSLAFYYGSLLVEDNERTPGAVLAVFFAVIIGAMGLGQTGPDVEAFRTSQGSAAKIFQIIASEPTINNKSNRGQTSKKTVSGDIRFRKVNFRYPARKDVQVFKGLDLEVKENTTVALVGSSGCGKSTIVGILERFYDVDSGEVTIGGKRISDIDIVDLRSSIGLVSQEPTLFATSIRKNILFGRRDATQEEVEQACKDANAYDFIMKLPDKFDTEVGERGVQLSGGQKQRIAIARALLKNPSILLLDEATSALDTESERIVQEALDRVMKGRTTIVIAHRLSTIRDATKIVVFQNGQIVEEGNHDQLLKQDGLYCQLLQKQRSSKDQDPQEEEEGFKFSLSRKESSGGRRSSAIRPDEGDLERREDDVAEEEEEEEEADYVVPVSRVIKLSKGEYVWYGTGVFAAMINGSVMPMFAIIFSELTAVLYTLNVDDDARDTVNFWCLMFVVLALSCLFANVVQLTSFTNIGENLTFYLRREGFIAVMRQSMAYFDDKRNTTGKITTRLATDAALVQGVAGSQIGLQVQNLVTLVVGLTIAFIAGPKLAAVILACIPLIMFAGYVQMNFLKGFSEQGKIAYQIAGQVIQESVSGVRTVAAFCSEAQVLEMYDDSLSEPERLGQKKGWISGFFFGLSNLFIFGTYSAAFGYGSVLIGDDEIDLNGLLKVFMALVMSAMGVGQTATFAPDAAKAKKAASTMFRLIDTKSEINNLNEDGTELDSVKGAVELRGVSFAYPSRPVTVLDRVNIKVKPGQVCALVGSSGCGKSTVLTLLERFYRPTGGEITIDGQDISKVSIQSLRDQLGLVSQEPTLFGTTIWENIVYSKPRALKEEVEQACKDANAYDFIMKLPDKFDTEVGERGVQLSGGQKQRIAIARALLKNPSILLLDEATSALDTESERIVQEALDRVMKGRTTIVIAHRLSTIRDADQIIVMKDGKVVEEGNHNSLMSQKGHYATLVSRQV